MKYDLVSPKKLIIGKSNIKGRGVFANEDIEKNEIVEECHFIFPEKNKGGEDKEMLRYMFGCLMLDDPKEQAIVSEKIYLHNLIDDEEVKESLLTQLKDLGYEDVGSLFSTAFVLGFGMIYNHSENPNINYEFDYDSVLYRYIANKNIKKGEELLISYGSVEERKDLK